jgi:hypothetical protein
MVFAAKGVNPTALPSLPSGTVDGGFAWVSVGNGTTTGTQGVLDNSSGGGFCGQSNTNEENCSLNKNVNNDAEDPRVASGTMNPANPTVPWVVWDETFNGVKQIFVSRLVGGTHFEIANSGQPLSLGANDSTRPDITFSGNTPYVSWREDEGGVTKGFVGHFVNATNPTFVLDESDVPLTPTGTGIGQADVRSPISSGCIATPFNSDGQACQGGSIGTPFFLFTDGTSPLNLFADAYQSDAPTTGAASSVTTNSATISGSVNPEGAGVNVSFDYGTTTAYGQSTAVQKTGPDNAPDVFTAQLTGLPAGTTIHYRAVEASDFGTQVGADQTFTTSSNSSPPPPGTTPPGPGKALIGAATVKGTAAFVHASCAGNTGATCKLVLRMTTVETLLGHRVIAVAQSLKKHKRVVTVGLARVTLAAGTSKTVKIPLNALGKSLLKRFHRMKVTLKVTQTLANGSSKTVAVKTMRFKARKRH